MEDSAVRVLGFSEKLSDLGSQRFCFDSEFEGVGCNIGKEKKLSPFWARRAKAKVERAAQRFLAGLLELDFSCGGLSHKRRPSFGRHSGCSFNLSPRPGFSISPTSHFLKWF
jgi:hypothetical protein